MVAPQRSTRSSIPTRCGAQIAPAAADVVRSGGKAALIFTATPASARQTAVVSPDTPAPITRTSGSLLVIYRP